MDLITQLQDKLDHLLYVFGTCIGVLQRDAPPSSFFNNPQIQNQQQQNPQIQQQQQQQNPQTQQPPQQPPQPQQQQQQPPQPTEEWDAPSKMALQVIETSKVIESYIEKLPGFDKTEDQQYEDLKNLNTQSKQVSNELLSSRRDAIELLKMVKESILYISEESKNEETDQQPMQQMSQLQADSLPQLTDVDKIISNCEKLKKLMEKHEQSIKQAALSLANVLGDDPNNKEIMDNIDKSFLTTIALEDAVITYSRNAANLKSHVERAVRSIQNNNNNNNNNSINNNDNNVSQSITNPSSSSSNTTTTTTTTTTTSTINTTTNSINNLEDNQDTRGNLSSQDRIGLGENLADKYLKDDYKRPLNLEKSKTSVKYNNLKREVHSVNHSTPLDGLNDEDEDLVVASQTISIICPLSQATLVEPVRAEQCGHVFSKAIILQMFKNSAQIPCPIAGCGRQIAKTQLKRAIDVEETVKKELRRKESQQRRNDDDITEV
ncbi:hypothetical protein ACTFIY_001741 [Dictyostelium cf. discoideum]